MSMRIRCPRQEGLCDRCPAQQIYSCLTPDQDELIQRERLCRRYDAGQVVVHCDTPALAVLSVHSGRVKLTRCHGSGHQFVVGLRGPGDLLGVREVLCATPHQVSVETLEPSALCAVPREAFLQVVRQCPELAMRLLRLLASDFLLAEEQLVARTQASVAARTAGLLARLTDGHESATGATGADVIRMSREEMALLVGTARETLSRVLSRLAAQGALESRHAGIRILNRPLLERLAER
jgi:CRP/FNR family transcriptional regulator, polysaccharide utilization system transcription regulator